MRVGSAQPLLDADPLDADTTPRGQKEWQTLVKTLPCPKLRLQAVKTVVEYAAYLLHNPHLSRDGSLPHTYRLHTHSSYADLSHNVEDTLKIELKLELNSDTDTDPD